MAKGLLVSVLVLFALGLGLLPASLWAEVPEAAAGLSCPRQRTATNTNASEEEMEVEEEGEDCEVVEEAEFDSTIRVAKFEFNRVETIFIILVFIIVVVLAKMGKWAGWLHTRPCLLQVCCIGNMEGGRPAWRTDTHN